jgi:hypothetical protein
VSAISIFYPVRFSGIGCPGKRRNHLEGIQPLRKLSDGRLESGCPGASFRTGSVNGHRDDKVQVFAETVEPGINLCQASPALEHQRTVRPAAVVTGPGKPRATPEQSIPLLPDGSGLFSPVLPTDATAHEGHPCAPQAYRASARKRTTMPLSVPSPFSWLHCITTIILCQGIIIDIECTALRWQSPRLSGAGGGGCLQNILLHAEAIVFHGL